MTTNSVVSIVAPLYNEEGVVRELHKRLVGVMNAYGTPYEIIFVDDGSHDKTFQYMGELQPLIAVRLKRNYGQTSALAAGIRQVKGNVIVLIDGDLENDPADIPKLLKKLNEGYDVVSGWRENRWRDKLFTRRLPSQLANKLISFISGVYLHDHGCALKVYQREVLDRLHLTGDMHRMIAAYAAREGARVVEIPVHFEPRTSGTSKYGLSRTLTVVLDIIAFHFFYRFARKPMHFFGGFGFFSFLIGASAFLYMLFLKYALSVSFIETPLPVLTAIFVIIGCQFVLMGLLAELFVRTKNFDEDPVLTVQRR